jgi:thiol-disulfide isomerase/thioredoxin
MLKKPFLVVCLVLGLILSSCSAPTSTPAAAMMESATPAAMMASNTPDAMMASMTPDAMMSASTPETMMGTNTPEAMMSTATSDAMMASKTPDAMMSTQTPDAMMANTPDAMMGSQTPVVMMGTPDWFSTSLTDVNSGKNLTISGLKGKVVVVETMATWCPNCLEQQKQIQAYLKAGGMNDQLEVISLDIDAKEDSNLLKSYAASHDFQWTHAIAPTNVAREIGQLYGDQFLNPTSTPILIVDKQGVTHLLPFGLKSADTLKLEIDKHLGM